MLDVDLDDLDALESGDPDGILRLTASAGAHVRESLHLFEDGRLAEVRAEGRPRCLVLVGSASTGAAARAGLEALNLASPVPVISISGPLPAWVGPLDLVIVLGEDPDTAVVLDQVARRGARLITVGVRQLAAVERARGVALHVERRGPDRALFWSYLIPVLLAADALGFITAGRAELGRVADALDEAALVAGPRGPLGENEAKAIALAATSSELLVVGTSPLTNAAAARFVSQLGLNAKLSAVSVELPSADYSRLSLLDGTAGESVDDIFRDPFEDATSSRPLRILLLEDAAADRVAAAVGESLTRLADARRVTLTTLAGTGAGSGAGSGASTASASGFAATALERFATLVTTLDFASVYAAVATGVDPSPTPAVRAFTMGLVDALEDDGR